MDHICIQFTLEPGVNQNLVPLKQMQDAALVAVFQDGSLVREAFDEIVGRYKERVYHHVRRIVIDHDDADDAAQNTFIRVWQNLGTFRGDSALFSWIYRIATNEALTLLRRKKPNLDMDSAAAELSALVDAGDHQNGDEIARKLQKALLTLPEKQRLVFHMKYFDDLTYDQIAEITGTSVGALKASYFHAVRKIEARIEREI